MAKRKRNTIEECATIKRIAYSESDKYMQISKMSDVIKSWVVRGEVSSISSMRSCTVGKIQKEVFNFDLRDDTGVVRVTAFEKTAAMIHDKLKDGMIMQIKNFKVKSVNPAFNSTGNDYEIEIDGRTVIREVLNCPAVEGTKCIHFTEFHDIQSTNESTVAINVVGIIKRVCNIKEVPSKTSIKPLLKRDVILMDDKKNTCVVTMWNDAASDWMYAARDIITITGAGINEFCGFHSVKLYRTSVIVKDADNPKTAMLKELLDELMP